MEVGFVKSIKGSIAYLDGLPSARIGDLVRGENDEIGYISALNSSVIEIMLINYSDVRPGQSFKPMGSGLEIGVGDFLLGRVINPLGEPVDGAAPFPKNSKTTSLEPEPVSLDKREFIKEQFETGITMVDTVIPLGKGQRELVLGDARSGKSGFVIDVIMNQKNKDIVCVYGCIGKPATDVYDLMGALKKNEASKNVVFVASFSGDAPPLIYLSPKSALAVATYFQKQGRDVLLILDDMGVHARVYREVSLLGGRTPGREAYPGDIFHEHAHILERAGKFNAAFGGGSITALPMMELGLTDFTGYIPTNLMSMTDGHFLFDATLYSQGQRPAIDLLLSVSRVGQQTQTRVQTELSLKIKQILTESARLLSLTSFSSELPPETQKLLVQRAMIMELFRQAQFKEITRAQQVVLMCLPFCQFLAGKDEKYLMAFKDKILNALSQNKEIKVVVDKALSTSGIEELIKSVDGISKSFQDEFSKLPVMPVTGQEVPTAISTKQPEGSK